MGQTPASRNPVDGNRFARRIVMPPRLIIGSIIHCYYADDWYDQGIVIAITGGIAEVDFLDWIQGWHVHQLRATVTFKLVFVPNAPGWLIRNFGQVIPPP